MPEQLRSTVPIPSVGTLADAVSSLDARAPVVLTPVLDAPVAERRSGSRWIGFTVGMTSYVVKEIFVTELDRVPRLTLVPQAPVWLRGVTSLRGDILSVVDLRVFIGLDPTSVTAGRMLVLRLPHEDFSLGLLVDAIDGVAMLDDDAIRPPASALEGPLAPFLTGMCVVSDRLVAALDLERLLRSSDIRQFDDVQEDPRCEAL